MSKLYPKTKREFLKQSTYLARIKYIENLLPKKRIRALDLGCGDGSTLEILHYLGFKNITGVDKLKMRRRNKFSSINFIKSDIVDFLNQKTSLKYNLITFFDVLEHINPEKVQEILNKCFYLLEEGGFIIIQIPNGASIFNGVYFYGDPTHIFTYNEYSLKNLLINSGFNKKNIFLKETTPIRKNLKGTIRFILWNIIRIIIRSIHIIETGNSPRINTRTLMCGAQKRKG